MVKARSSGEVEALATMWHRQMRRRCQWSPRALRAPRTYIWRCLGALQLLTVHAPRCGIHEIKA